jgi:DNA-directed RNA polymerase subunit RPC12/RpoP
MKSKFTKGRTTYKCANCGKLTRDTGQEESNTDLCKECAKNEQLYNMHSDEDHEEDFDICEICKTYITKEANEYRRPE